MRVIVAGGSLGGLTAALVLRDLGARVDVYERSPHELSSRGAGIVVHPETVRWLVDRGGVPVTQISVGSTALRHLDRSGGVAFESPSAYRFTAWNTLYRRLRAAFGDEAHHLGEALVSVASVRDGAEVTFASGARRRADLVVAADGVDSTVRAREMPRVALRYAGYVGWRGMVDEGDLEPATMDALHDAITYFAAPGTHIVVYPIPDVDGALARGSRRVNYVWYRNVARGPALDALLTDASGVRRGTSLPPGAVAPRFVAELRAAAGATLPPQLAEVVTRTREPFVQTIADLECPRMALGRVALIGDAAFVARPHAAAGTAKACANAWALAPALGSGDGDVEGALARWEAGQLALGRALVRRAAVNGDRSQFGGGWTPGDRSLAFGLREPGDSEVV